MWKLQVSRSGLRVLSNSWIYLLAIFEFGILLPAILLPPQIFAYLSYWHFWRQGVTDTVQGQHTKVQNSYCISRNSKYRLTGENIYSHYNPVLVISCISAHCRTPRNVIGWRSRGVYTRCQLFYLPVPFHYRHVHRSNPITWACENMKRRLTCCQLCV